MESSRHLTIPLRIAVRPWIPISSGLHKIEGYLIEWIASENCTCCQLPPKTDLERCDRKTKKKFMNTCFSKNFEPAGLYGFLVDSCTPYELYESMYRDTRGHKKEIRTTPQRYQSDFGLFLEPANASCWTLLLQLSQYTREACGYKERKGHPRIAWKLEETISIL